MFFLPLFHRLQGRSCLIIGGGATALRKLRWLIRSGAQIQVVAPVIDPEIRRLAEQNNIMLLDRVFEHADIHADLTLVICATDAASISEEAYALSMQHRVLVNCVDRTDLCTVIFPAIVDRFPILVAISSMGQSPTLARTVRGWIEQRLPNALGRLARLAGALRTDVKDALADVDARKAFWEKVFGGPAAELAMQEKMAEAVAMTRAQLADETPTGSLVLLGAGPGDPELITLKGLRALQSADVILYDKLANPALLEYARRDAELIDVGKIGPREAIFATPSRDQSEALQKPRESGTTMQARINAKLVDLARGGKQVVRLKGGDAFIFGRGGEELLVAQEAGIAVEIIPGITAGMGASSYFGIPLTHRDLSQSVRFVTGHRLSDSVYTDWPEMAKPHQTLVIYMGLVTLPTLTRELIKAGRDGATPAVLIENATLPAQRAVYGVLADLAARVEAAQITGPSIVIVGEVVSISTGYVTAVTVEKAVPGEA